jgi:hypothetical protein
MHSFLNVGVLMLLLCCAALYIQAREALFGREITDYDCLARVRKALEPYANLWTTARDWAKLSNEWRTGSFLVRSTYNCTIAH